MTEQEIMQRLAAPFAPDQIKRKPGKVSKDGKSALVLWYVDARAVEQRLDDVFGVSGWQDDYQPCEGGTLLCRLKVRIDGEWIQKCGVGAQSEQPDEGDKVKAAESDALKRAAVKFGIGRFLYAMGHQWAEFDSARKQFTGNANLPAIAQQRLPEPAREPASGLRKAALAILEPAAQQGMDAYARAWERLNAQERKAVLDVHPRLKEMAGKVVASVAQ